MALRGSPEERRKQKAAARVANQVKHVRALASQAQGHRQVIVACNAALAASKRCSTPADQEQLARMVAETIEQFEANSREQR